MEAFTEIINVATTQRIQFVDITDDVLRLVNSSGIREGVVTVFTQHTTTAIKINEKCDRLQNDMVAAMDRLAPWDGTYMHNEQTVDNRPNGASHVKSLFLNASEHIPVKNREVLLGGWQRIFFVELDGSRNDRRVIVSVVGVK